MKKTGNAPIPVDAPAIRLANVPNNMISTDHILNNVLDYIKIWT